MSFLKRGINGYEQDPEEALEEQYKRLFPKLGRDFVTKRDLEILVDRLRELMDPAGVNPVNLDDSAARELNEHYKQVLDSGEEGADAQRDLDAEVQSG